MVEEIYAVATKQMGGGLVGDNAQRPSRPTWAEKSANPGKFYGTNEDPLAGYAPSTDVIDLFAPPEDDGEGGKRRKFVSGTLYAWAKADPVAFHAWYEFTTKNTLNLAALHPEQRRLMGIIG